MKYPTPARFKTTPKLAAALAAIDPSVQPDAEPPGPDGPFAQPFERDGLRVENRFAIHPMEGWDGTPGGSPSDLTLRRWERFGLSGAGLIWGGEAFAVTPDARANPNQLALFDPATSARDLERLMAALHAGRRASGLEPETLVAGLQLTHSGRFSRPSGQPAPRIAHHHPQLDARLGLDGATPLLTDAELEGLIAPYVEAARLAQQAGFQFVDIKACHGYLLHELLAARTRPGPFGGEALAARAKLLLDIIDAVRSACPGLRIGVRLSAHDIPVHGPGPDGVGVPLEGPEPFAQDLAESEALIQLLAGRGVHWINLTIGSPYSCPHLQRPAAYPPTDGYAPPADPLIFVVRHLQVARRLRHAAADLALVGSGYSYLMEHLASVAQAELRAGHVDLVGIGRLVLSYPEFPLHVLRGEPLQRRLFCRTFSDCTNAPRAGHVSGCFPLDPHYKTRPEAPGILGARPSW